MTSILFFIAGIALGFYIKSKTAKTFTPKQAEEMSEMRAEAHEALTERTEMRKQKILELMKGEAVHQEELKRCNVADIKKGIASENVEKLFDVSNATARKYLNELESENKILPAQILTNNLFLKVSPILLNKSFTISQDFFFSGFGRLAKCSLLKIAGSRPAPIMTAPIIMETVRAPRTGSASPVSGFLKLYIMVQHQGAINHGT